MPRIKRTKNISSLSFNGTNGRLQLIGGGSSSILPTTFFSVYAWIKTSGSLGAAAMVIIARDDNSSGRVFNLSVNSSGYPTFAAYKGGPSGATATGSRVVTDNNWHFLTGTWDGTTITLYMDGDSVGTASLSGTAANQNTNAYVGLGIRSGTSEWFNGLMCRVGVFNTVFTQEMHKDVMFNIDDYSEYALWLHDPKRNIIAGSSSNFVHDVGNVLTTNSVVAVTLSNEVPNWNTSANIPITKTLVSSNAKGATIFNTASYCDQYLYTYNGNQYIIYVDTSLNVYVGKRATGSSSWSLVDTGYNITEDDDHNVAALGIDDDGYIHIAWDHHATALEYARSDNPEDITAFTTRSMIGTDETSVSYPRFFNANGKLFFAYRDGGSVSGDEILNRYDTATTTWSRLHKLVDGKTYNYGTYPDGYVVDNNGRIHHSFCWRVAAVPNILYENYTYMYSDDDGETWVNSKGIQYNLPVTPDQAGDILSGNLPLFWPMSHIAIDDQGRPHIAYTRSSSRIFRDNLWHTYLDDGGWIHYQITDYSNTISSLQTFGNYNFSGSNHVIDRNTGRVYQFCRFVAGGEIQMFTSIYPYTEWDEYRLGDPTEGWGYMAFGGIDYQQWLTNGTLNMTGDQSTSANPTSLYVIECDLNEWINRHVAVNRTAASSRTRANTRISIDTGETIVIGTPTVPDAPTIGTATAGDQQASVTFTAPADNGGSTITGYTVTSSPGGLTGTGTSSPIVVTGLTNDIEYTFTVVATNAIGDSDPSAASNAVTPTNPGIALDYAVAGGITNPGTTHTWAHVCNGSNRVLFVYLFGNNASDNLTGITYNGVSMSLVAKRQVPTDRWTYMYYMIAPPVGTYNIVATASGSIAMGGVSASYTGANQSTQPEVSTTNTASSVTSITTNLTTVTDKSWTIIGAKSTSASSISAGTGVTHRATQGDTIIGDSNGPITPAGTTSMQINRSGSGNFAAVMASIKPA